MTTADHFHARARDASPGDVVPLWRVALFCVAAFGALWLLQTLAAIGELQRRGGDGSIAALFIQNGLFYPPWVTFGVALFAAVDRRRERLAEARTLASLFVASTLLFFIPYIVYEVSVSIVAEGASLRELPLRIRNWPPFFYFVDFVLFAGCFASIYAAGVARGQLLRDRQRRELESRMLALELELARQRVASIQAQLEPHFLFNSLNAIGALIRSEERATALSALARLSDLLRYALTSSRLDEVTLREELAFVNDYLDLQRLRYGPRLHVAIETADESLLDLRCPPLLLQPLVENALRHDLDAHEGDSDLHLRVERSGEGAIVTISNPVRTDASPNAGFGLGLGATRERLALRYGEAAQLTTSVRDGRFEAQFRLPEDPVA